MQFDPLDVREAIATMPCARCGNIGGNATIELEGPHFGRITCASCDSWIDWLGWPPERPSERKRRRPRIQGRLGADHCEICLRSRFEIPIPGVLEEHHVVEHAEGGDDDPDNTRVYCTACHRLVTWARTYFGHYHPHAEDEAA